MKVRHWLGSVVVTGAAASLGGCASFGPSSAPPPRPLAVEVLPPPPAPPRLDVRVRVGEAATLRGEVVGLWLEEPSLARIFEREGGFAIVGRKLGKTTARMTLADGESRTLDVEVVAGEPPTRALGVGESLVLSGKDVKEYSVGLPEIVVVAPTTDGARLVVTGRRPGRTSLLLFDRDGAQHTHDLLVLDGRR